jgi:hypothetical protein
MEPVARTAQTLHINARTIAHLGDEESNHDAPPPPSGGLSDVMHLSVPHTALGSS